MMDKGIQKFISDLIEVGYRTPANRFKERLTGLLAELIPFDKALWASGHIQNFRVHNAYLFRLPAGMMDNWERYKNQDRLLAQLIKKPGQTLDVYDFYSRTERASLAVYRQHSSLYGIENAISTAVPEPRTGLLEIMSLYRSRAEDSFSPREREIKQFVFPLMIKAWHLNQSLHFRNKAQDVLGGAAAICDREGLIRHFESQFIDLLLKDWPGWTGPVLPEALTTWLAGTETKGFSGENLSMIRHRFGDLALLQAYPSGVLKLLSAREEQVAQSFAAGLTHKEIGRELNLSPSTIRRHIESIYRKLEVSNKLELFQALNPET